MGTWGKSIKQNNGSACKSRRSVKNWNRILICYMCLRWGRTAFLIEIIFQREISTFLKGFERNLSKVWFLDTSAHQSGKSKAQQVDPIECYIWPNHSFIASFPANLCGLAHAFITIISRSDTLPNIRCMKYV